MNTVKTVHKLGALLVIGPVQLVLFFRVSIRGTYRY